MRLYTLSLPHAEAFSPEPRKRLPPRFAGGGFGVDGCGERWRTGYQTAPRGDLGERTVAHRSNLGQRTVTARSGPGINASPRESTAVRLRTGIDDHYPGWPSTGGIRFTADGDDRDWRGVRKCVAARSATPARGRDLCRAARSAAHAGGGQFRHVARGAARATDCKFRRIVRDNAPSGRLASPSIIAVGKCRWKGLEKAGGSKVSA